MAALQNTNGAIAMGRILIVLGIAAIAFAAWALVFGQSVKPLGEVGDGLPLWSLIAICAAIIGVSDAAIGAYIVRQARRNLQPPNPGPKR